MNPRNLFAILVFSGCAASGQALITTLAGTGTCSYSGDGGPAAQATICNPQGAVTDGFGNIYFADTANFAIRKITTAGVISTIAGNGIRGTAGDGGPATNANLGLVYQIAYDGVSNLCFGDVDVHKLRCVFFSSGNIVSFGTGNPVSAGDGGAFYNASFNQPKGIAFVPRSIGNAFFTDIYISDSNDNVVRRVDGSTGLISTVVGPGTPGVLGDGGPGTSASLLSPGALTYFNGAIYIADTLNNRIRQLTLSTGVITTVAGNGVPYFAGDGGLATSAQLMSPGEVTFDSVGNMYITDRGNERIRKVDASGIINTVAGNGGEGWGQDGVPATQTAFGGLEGVFWNTFANQLLISDGANRLRQVTYQISTTSLNLSPNPVPVGSPVTMTATVTPSTATGLVNFYVNNALFASVPLNGGTAVATWTAAGAGPVLQAVYEGDTTYAPSASGAEGEAVQLTPTSTTLVSTPNPSVPNQNVAMTVMVTPSAATGKVTIYRNGTFLGTPTLVNGTATINTSFTAKGPVTIYAVYGGDNTYASSYTPLQTQSVVGATTTVVTSTQNPSNSAAAVTFVATVSPSAATGTVQFLDGTTVLGTVTLTSGSASYTTSALTQGTHSITAVYSGDSSDSGSTSPVLSQVVKLDPGVAVTSGLNPSIIGQTVTFTATLNPAATGTVQFLDGATSLATVPVSAGTAVYATSALTQGAHQISVSYSGDSNYSSASSSAITQTVSAKTSTTTTVNPSANPAAPGAQITFTAGVVPATATGTVQFLDGANVLGSVALSAGSAAFSTSVLTPGTHPITAVYSGDAANASSTSVVLSQTVNPQTVTSISIVTSQNPIPVGGPVTFYATVNPTSATGTVQFLDGATVLSTVTITSGFAATYTTSSLTQGNHSITAVYSGDAGDTASTSAVLSEGVRVVTPFTMGSSLNPSIVGQSVTFTANITAAATGSVQFLDGAAVLATVPLSFGIAAYSTAALTQGAHSISATYAGDSTYWSGLATLTQTVNPKTTTTTTMTSTPNPSFSGTQVTFIAALSPATATGNVQFLDGTTVLGAVALANGSASFSTSALTQGTHSITASYAGDALDNASTSAVLSQAVKLSAGMTGGLSPSPAVVGQTVTLSANINPAATGTVTFTDGSATLAIVNVSAGTASVSTTALTQGTHTLGISYSGDATYMAVATTVPETVLGATSIALSSNLDPSVVGQTVTFIATVTPAAATGNVQFYDGSTLIATVALNAGTAAFASSSLAQGSHSMTADYQGNSNYAWSFGSPLTQVVKGVTSAAISSSINPSTSGQSVTFTATVSPSTATGTVQFLDGGSVIGTATLSSGHAAFSTASLAVGSHSIQASYSGDGNYAPSLSAALTQVVNAALPGAPSNLTATANGSSQINLAWTASPTTGVTYDVYGSTTSGFVPSAANRIVTGVATTTYSATGLTASTIYYFRVTAVKSGGESAATNQASATTTGAAACHVTYSVSSQWNNGFNGAFTIKNTGTAPFTSWNLTWTWAGNQKVTQSWNADYHQTGPNVSFTNMSYNASIAPGATLSGMGFGASYQNTNTSPTVFYVNGVKCQ